MDEASCLRNYGTKTSQEFSTIFKGVDYRFLATATPCPNDYIELVNYADFLGVCDRGQALTRWFARDSSEAGNLKLYPHEEERFWLWVASWGVFVRSPADLGHDDAGYALPPINVHWHDVTTDYKRAAKETRLAGPATFNSENVRRHPRGGQRASRIISAADRPGGGDHQRRVARRPLDRLALPRRRTTRNPTAIARSGRGVWIARLRRTQSRRLWISPMGNIASCRPNRRSPAADAISSDIVTRRFSLDPRTSSTTSFRRSTASIGSCKPSRSKCTLSSQIRKARRPQS